MKLYKLLSLTVFIGITLCLANCAKPKIESNTVNPVVIPEGIPPIKIDTYYPTPVVTKKVVPPSIKPPRVTNYS